MLSWAGPEAFAVALRQEACRAHDFVFEAHERLACPTPPDISLREVWDRRSWRWMNHLLQADEGGGPTDLADEDQVLHCKEVAFQASIAQRSGSSLRDMRLALRGDAKTRIAALSEDIQAWDETRQTAIDLIAKACARNGYLRVEALSGRGELVFGAQIGEVKVLACCDRGGAKRLAGVLPLRFEIEVERGIRKGLGDFMNVLPGLEEYFNYACGWIGEDGIFYSATDGHFAIVGIEAALRIGTTLGRTLVRRP